jgi:uncharacterized protein (DUF1800 family)
MSASPARVRFASLIVYLLQLVITPAVLSQPATTFEEWQAANFDVPQLADDSVSGLQAAPRGDGFTNLAKYALGLTFLEAPQTAWPTIIQVAPQMEVTFERPVGLTDLTYEIQFSSEIGNPDAWVTAAQTTEAIDAVTERVTALDPIADADRRFARFLVTHESGVVVSGPARELIATKAGPTEVALSWTGDDHEGGFLIQQSKAGGPFDIIGYVNANTTDFLVENLIPGDEVTFRANAVGPSVDTSPSNAESVTPELGDEGAVLLKIRNKQPNNDVVVDYEIRVENSTSEAIPLSDLTLRYWMEFDNENALNTPIYYATTGSSGENIGGSITVTAIPATQPQAGADYHVDFTFDADAGTLLAGDTGNPGIFFIQGAMHKNYSPGSFDTSNDFSQELSTSFLINNRMNILRNGELIFGIEPGGGMGNTNRPAGPSALRATPMSESSIELTWEDLATNETLYVIEREFEEEVSGFKILTTVDPDSTAFQDSQLLDEAGYSYRVRAVNPDGISSATNIATATTFEGTSPEYVPVAPEELLITPFSDGRLDLNWSDASRNEKGFLIERLEAGGSYTEIGRVNPGTTAFIDYGLDSSTSYSYRITAYNLAGSAATDPASGSTDSPQAPTTPSDAEIVRFLRQASFGATPALIAEVRTMGFAAWLDAQFALAPTMHEPTTPPVDFEQDDRIEIWWDAVLTAPDQARQRLAFALSQIFVVSQNDGDLSDQAHALAKYYDMLVTAPESNFRELLEDITFSPVMGVYLDHTRNQKAISATNIRPDENYAREIMQLFTIGLNQLNLDGTPKLDEGGNKIPTYNQRDIEQVARIFTGLTFAGSTDFFTGDTNLLEPMILFPDYHENGSKTFDLLGSDIASIDPLEPGGDHLDDFEKIHDGLAGHSNAAPFLCRQLIQRTVTSNPSPAYIQRVSEVFEDNGSGQRGDFEAVFKAILLDYEARSADPLDSDTYGKQREPLIRLANVLRMLDASAGKGGFGIGDLTDRIQQAPLRAPTVFNFFEPDFSLPGPITSLGIDSPEFQTTQSSTVIESANLMDDLIFGSVGTVQLDFSRYSDLSGTPSALVDQLDIDLMDGRMPVAMELVIEGFVDSLGDDATQRAKSALYLVTTSAEFVIEQ